MVGGVVVEPPRAEETRVGGVGVLPENRLGAAEDGVHVGRDDLLVVRGERLVEVNVSPRPEVRGGRQHARVGERDVRKRPAGDVRALGELLLRQHDERDPRPQPEVRAVDGRRCVPPGEILVVEVDGDEVVRLEVRDPVARLGADDRARIDADEIARAVERDVLRQRLRELRAARDRIADELQLDMRGRARLHAVVAVCGGDRVPDAAPEPRQERIRRQAAHAATSNAGSTCNVPASPGSAATALAR